jgi:hypothetical protein
MGKMHTIVPVSAFLDTNCEMHRICSVNFMVNGYSDFATDGLIHFVIQIFLSSKYNFVEHIGPKFTFVFTIVIFGPIG